MLKLIIQTVGGIAIFIGILISFIRVKSHEENNRLVESGNTAKRFNNAISNLGSNNSTIVLGGIYALHQIAKDNLDYREQVFNIFISFINLETSKLLTWKDIPKSSRFDKKPTNEVQTIIDLLFKRDNRLMYQQFKAVFSDIKIYGADLSNCDFSLSFIKNSELQNCNFEKALFVRSKISNCDFTFSNFSSTKFTGARLVDKTLFLCCKISFTKFVGCICNEVDFSCSFINGNFNESQLHNCVFDGCHISQVNAYEGFNASILNRISYKGTSSSGIPGRGCLTGNVVPLSFYTLMNGQTEKNGNYENPTTIEPFPTERIEEFKSLINMDDKYKHFYHTLHILTDSFERANGLSFTDTGALSKKEVDRIIGSYEEDMNFIKNRIQ